MTREQHVQEILKLPNESLLLELPTSFGKSKVAIELIRKYARTDVLIVVPRLVLIKNWLDELKKWKFDRKVKITTYKSLDKHCGVWDVVIFDECQHYTERCQEIIDEGYHIDHAIGLSATVPFEIKMRLADSFPQMKSYKVTAKEAIDEEILPDPKVFLLKLYLDNTYRNQQIILNPKKGNPLVVDYPNRWGHLKDKSRMIIINCTPTEYYLYVSQKIDWIKKQYFMTNQAYQKNQWLFQSGNRLKWLSAQKNDIVKQILEILDNYRTLTFCSDIKQTEILGQFCINSKNNHSEELLQGFNDEKIDHITACNMLNEGINLRNCQVGIYANLNSSQVIVKQRLGRILRHQDPMIVIPYFYGTRDAELVENMMKDYNPELVTEVTDIEKLKKLI